MLSRTSQPAEFALSDIALELAKVVVIALVVLALVFVARIRQTAPPETPLATTGVDQARRAAAEVEGDVKAIAGQIRAIDAEMLDRKEERAMLTTLMAASEREIAKHRSTLDDNARRSYDQERALADAKAELAKLEFARSQPVAAKAKNVKIESYPTPISKPVDDKEVHLQLRDGRVAIVPVEELVGRLKNTVHDKVHRLRDSNEMTDSVGPVDGFRMRYTLVRVDFSGQDSGRGGSMVQLDHWELLPVMSDLGETLDEALRPLSHLNSKLDRLKPGEHTVTLWTYPDSFDAFRALRKMLYERGFHVAGRPLPEGIPIGGSPHGTKSAAQ